MLENIKFWKLHLFPSSREERETPTLLALLERAKFNLTLVVRILDDGQNPETQ
jgi:hypothetical protein